VTARDVALSLFPDVAPDRPVGPLLGSVVAGTNADLIAAVAPLYLDGNSVMDVTYGEGKWWARYRPENFTYHDLHKVDGVDFRHLPEATSSIDAVCFDPPYTISGSASSSRLGPEFQDRYGIGTQHMGPLNTAGGSASFETLILDGLAECVRVSRRWVLVKCMEFSQGNHVPKSRSFHDIPHLVTARALELGCVKNDQIVHHTGAGPGGHNIFEPRRARRHHSYLLVFEAPSALDYLDTEATHDG
jgi:hypothetical protein